MDTITPVFNIIQALRTWTLPIIRVVGRFSPFSWGHSSWNDTGQNARRKRWWKWGWQRDVTSLVWCMVQLVLVQFRKAWTARGSSLRVLGWETQKQVAPAEQKELVCMFAVRHVQAQPQNDHACIEEHIPCWKKIAKLSLTGCRIATMSSVTENWQLQCTVIVILRNAFEELDHSNVNQRLFWKLVGYVVCCLVQYVFDVDLKQILWSSWASATYYLSKRFRVLLANHGGEC